MLYACKWIRFYLSIHFFLFFSVSTFHYISIKKGGWEWVLYVVMRFKKSAYEMLCAIYPSYLYLYVLPIPTWELTHSLTLTCIYVCKMYVCMYIDMDRRTIVRGFICLLYLISLSLSLSFSSFRSATHTYTHIHKCFQRLFAPFSCAYAGQQHHEALRRSSSLSLSLCGYPFSLSLSLSFIYLLSSSGLLSHFM
jgi:hypothetical protein